MKPQLLSSNFGGVSRPDQVVKGNKELGNNTKVVTFIPRLRRREWYQGILGTIDVHDRSQSVGLRTAINVPDRRFITEARIVAFSPSFLNRRFELCFENGLGRISRSLRTYPVMNEGAAIFKMCHSGNVSGLQDAFSSGVLSPFVLDNRGRTLLHVSAPDHWLKNCD